MTILEMDKLIVDLNKILQGLKSLKIKISKTQRKTEIGEIRLVGNLKELYILANQFH